jgi:hypothetical protein
MIGIGTPSLKRGPDKNLRNSSNGNQDFPKARRYKSMAEQVRVGTRRRNEHDEYAVKLCIVQPA